MNRKWLLMAGLLVLVSCAPSNPSPSPSPDPPPTLLPSPPPTPPSYSRRVEVVCLNYVSREVTFDARVEILDTGRRPDALDKPWFLVEDNNGGQHRLQRYLCYIEMYAHQ